MQILKNRKIIRSLVALLVVGNMVSCGCKKDPQIPPITNKMIQAADGYPFLQVLLLDLQAGKEGNINHKNVAGDGETALHLAAILKRQDILQALLKRGADVNAKDDANRTVLYLAVDANKVTSVYVLLQQQGLDPNVEAKIGLTPLCVAIKKVSVEIVTLLAADQRVDVNLACTAKGKPLKMAEKYLMKANPADKPQWQAIIDVLKSNGATA